VLEKASRDHELVWLWLTFWIGVAYRGLVFNAVPSLSSLHYHHPLTGQLWHLVNGALILCL